MFVYLLLILWCSFCAYRIHCAPNSRQTEKRLFFLLFILACVLVEGVRSEMVGTDTPGYVRRISYMAGFSLHELVDYLWHGDLEFLSMFILTCFYKLANNEITMFLGVAIYAVSIELYAINKFSKSIFWSLFFFIVLQSCYLASFSGARQAFAQPILIFSYRFIHEKRLLPFLICIVIAFCFHKSSIAFIPIYFIAQTKLSIKKLLLFALISFVVVYYFERFVSLGTIVSERYGGYLYEAERNATEGMRGVITACFLMFIMIVLVIMRPKIQLFRREYDVLLQIYLFGLCFAFAGVFLQAVYMGIRLARFGEPALLFLIPIIWQNISNTNNRVIISSILFLGGIGYYCIILNRFNDLLPYTINPILL